jgi:hypothetical protein
MPGQVSARVGGMAALRGLHRSFAGYDLVPLVEQHTGVRFDARAVELYVLRWAAPHGIRLTGTRFLTDIRYDADREAADPFLEDFLPRWSAYRGRVIPASRG